MDAQNLLDKPVEEGVSTSCSSGGKGEVPQLHTTSFMLTGQMWRCQTKRLQLQKSSPLGSGMERKFDVKRTPAPVLSPAPWTGCRVDSTLPKCSPYPFLVSGQGVVSIARCFLLKNRTGIGREAIDLSRKYIRVIQNQSCTE